MRGILTAMTDAHDRHGHHPAALGPQTVFSALNKTKTVCNVKVVPVAPSVMNSLFLSLDEAKTWTMSVLKVWASGVFIDGSTPEAKAAFAKWCQPDVQTIVEAPMKNTDGYKTYEGETGFFEYMAFRKATAFTGFTVEGISVINNAIIVVLSYSITINGKTTPRMTDIHRWVLKDMKVSAFKIYYGNPAALDECYAA